MAFDVGAVVGRLEMNIKGWKDSVKTVKEDQKSLSGFALRHGDEIKKLGKSLAIAGGAATAAFGLMIKGAADAGDNINDLSQRTGIATEILSGYKLAADKSGTSLEGFATGMKGLSTQMGSANDGGKEAVGLFKDLGVSFTDADGKLRPLNDVFLDVADRLSKMEDGENKLILANGIFGRSGMDLIPMLNMGRDGLQENYDITKKLGGIWSKEGAQAADDFNDKLAELKTATGGLGKEIGTALMPMVKDFIEKARDTIAKVSAWAKEHPGLTKGLAGTALALGALATAIGPVLMALPGLIKGIQALKTLSATPIVITVLIAIPAITKAVADFKAAFENMSGAMKEEGSSKFVSVLEGINSGIRKVFLGMNDAKISISEVNAQAGLFAREGGKGMKDVVLETGDALNDLSTFVGPLPPKMEDLRTKVKAVVTVIETAIPAANDLRDAFYELGAEITETPIPAARDLKFALEAIPGAMPAIPKAAGEATRETKTLFDGLWSDIAQGFGDTIETWLSGATTFKDFMKGLWGDIKDAMFAAIGQEVTKELIGLMDGILSKTKDVGSAAAGMGTGLAGLGTGIAGLVKGLISILPAMATAIATAATTLAAAAPAIITVGLIALGMMAGIKLLGAIFSKGGSGAGDGMGRVVERQDQQTSLLTSIKDFCLNDIHVGLLNLGRIMDSVTAGGWTNNWLKKIDTDILACKSVLGGMVGASEGAVLTSPQLVMTHGTPSLPEYVVPSAKMGAMGPGGGGKIEVHIHVEGQVITDRDYFRKRVIPEMTEAARAGLMKAFQESMVGA